MCERVDGLMSGYVLCAMCYVLCAMCYVQVFGCGMTRLSTRCAAGVRKAPRHEIAGSGAPAVPRALWRVSRGTWFVGRVINFSKGGLASKACTTLAFLLK